MTVLWVFFACLQSDAVLKWNCFHCCTKFRRCGNMIRGIIVLRIVPSQFLSSVWEHVAAAGRELWGKKSYQLFEIILACLFPTEACEKKKKKTTAWGKVEDCIGYGDWTTLHTVHGPASVFLVYATVCIAGSMEVKHFSRIARPVRLIYYEVNNISNKMVGFIKFYVFGPSWLLNFWNLPNFLPFSICCKRIAGAQIKMCAATPAKILTFI